MNNDLKALRALCDAAGDEWTLTEVMGHSHIHDADGITVIGYTTKGRDCIWSMRARFIAATDPTTVRALIDEIERLRKEIEILNHAFDLCHLYNGNMKHDYFNSAKVALEGSDDE